jgi:hypothetical protein
VAFDDPTGTDHDFLGMGLRKALYNYMHGIGLDVDVREWFDMPGPKRARGKTKRSVPRTTVPPDLIERSLA